MKKFYIILAYILIVFLITNNKYVYAEEINNNVVNETQKVKVIITKIDEDGNALAGATLQIVDSKGEIIEEWITDGNAYETSLIDGTYTLHEKEAPDGYILSEDKEFTIKFELNDINAGADFSKTPCEHYNGTPMYYVEIEGKKQEAYCINQNWETPDSNSTYDGKILNKESIRDYTKQTIPIGLDSDNPTKAIMSNEPIDVSDQTLSDQELYDKLLDIIYHRYTASEELSKKGLTYTPEEIRFVTEVALKNYTNPGITELQYNIKATDDLINTFDEAGIIYKTYIQNGKKYISYLKHNYRDYVYVPEAPIGDSIVKNDYGKGDSFGQMIAGHWASKHGANINESARSDVARYYELFKYLIKDEDHHPDNMHLYIYSSNTVPQDLSNNDNDARYQNLLGITGFFNNIKEQKEEITTMSKYSNKTININVLKIWNNDNSYLRPKSIAINLFANNILHSSIKLNSDNNWKYTFENLALYEKGNIINYTISEDKIPYYYSEITGDMYNGFVITNTQINEEENPKTYDNIYNYILMLFISIFTIIIISINYKTKNIKAK